jgi:hypothetical protein
MKPARILPPLAVCLGLLVPSAAFADVTPFVGTYALDEAASDDMAEAFEPAIREMSMVVRPLARRRVRDIRPDASTRFEHSAEGLIVQSGERTPVTLPPNGDPVERTTGEGDTVRLSVRVEGDVLRLRMEGERGRSTSEYRLSPDGETLTVVTTLDFDRLPRPVRYRLVYRRR